MSEDAEREMYMHETDRRSDALFVAQKVNPKASTEEVIEEAKKLTAYILNTKPADVLELVAQKEK
ncbi:hypothetical protein KAR91_12800 [Candidatus Pacearchaeota archaeon]|nr:hypothetical protein [Candidatus Pacearchaeota archaeon]